MFHSDGFRALDRQECLRLLAKVPVGRVVYTRRALPAVLPVNFCLDTDSSVLLRTSASSGLLRAIDGVVVAFEADDFKGDLKAVQQGWSVVVTGKAAVVTDPAEHERLSRTGPRSWAVAHDGVFVRIGSEMVTGRECTGPHGVA
jgi:nitroimidazol reductase NimA-like FMN-containing flavoprotein (pyridoxamine 5'-phosphate oxidase superfamily)